VTAALIAGAIFAPAGQAYYAEGIGSPGDRERQAWKPPASLQSPDAQDAARGSEIDHSRPVPSLTDGKGSANRFEWADAGIGAALMLGLLGLATGSGALVSRHRRRRGRLAPTG
jgi:hypothetical protein